MGGAPQSLFVGDRDSYDILIPLVPMGKISFQLKCRLSMWKIPIFKKPHGLKISSFDLKVLRWYLLGAVNCLLFNEVVPF